MQRLNLSKHHADIEYDVKSDTWQSLPTPQVEDYADKLKRDDSKYRYEVTVRPVPMKQGHDCKVHQNCQNRAPRLNPSPEKHSPEQDLFTHSCTNYKNKESRKFLSHSWEKPFIQSHRQKCHHNRDR